MAQADPTAAGRRKLRGDVIKHSKAAASYTPHAAHHSERCGVCTHFETPNACQLVLSEGPPGIDISPQGWCVFFNAHVRQI